MNKSFVFILALCYGYHIHGQDLMDNYHIGHYFDINKQPIVGYYDFDYEPEKSLKVSYTVGEDFTPGHYYDIEGLKIEGLLKYSQRNTYFKFKSHKQDDERIIKPDQCRGYMVGVDSFAVISNFDVQRPIGAFQSLNREYVEVIDIVDNLTFYKHTRAGPQNIIETYIVKSDSTEKYISFPKGAIKFKEVATKIFDGFELLTEGIQSGKYDNDDIPTMIKLLKYRSHFEQGKSICFNKSWDEIESCDDCSYYAKIESIEDSIFHLSYHFNNGIKIYEGDFTSFYPHKKRGEFNFFYPDGAKRKKIIYIHNKPKYAIDYYNNGNNHREYRITEDGIIYTQVFDMDGKPLFNEGGNGVESFYDSINDRNITYQYISNVLNNVHYLDENRRKVFQYCEKNAKLRGFKTLQGTITAEVDYPMSSVRNYNHGYVLIRCMVEPTGLISDFEIIKTVDSQCDSVILDFIENFKTYKYWKPGQFNGEKVAQEIVVPIDFSINGFSRFRNHYNHFWMHQHMMMHQQFNVPSPPPMPSGF